MAFTGFTASDFKIFDLKGFQPRMTSIRGQIRPKLEADDTWVAFGPDKRGYKKHCHFKVVVSRRSIRFLFEAGPEFADKKKWVAAVATFEALAPLYRLHS